MFVWDSTVQSALCSSEEVGDENVAALAMYDGETLETPLLMCKFGYEMQAHIKKYLTSQRKLA